MTSVMGSAGHGGRVIIGIAASLVLWSAGPGVPAGAQGGGASGTAVIVHGLAGFPADVYLDGSSVPALSSFEFRRVTEPLAVPAGSHRADLRRAGEPPDARPG
jgi:hypothetical protein